MLPWLFILLNRPAQIGADIKEIILDQANQRPLAHAWMTGRQQTEYGIEFIDGTERIDANIILGNTHLVSQAGVAIIARFGVNPREVNHMNIIAERGALAP